MPLTTHNITGSLTDADGNPLQVGTVTFTPFASHDARVDGASVLLGSIVRDIKDLPDPLAITEGNWTITISTRAQQQVGAGTRPVFASISRSVEITAATTWGAFVSGTLDAGVITSTLVDQAQQYRDEAEVFSATTVALQDAAVEALVQDTTAPNLARSALDALYVGKDALVLHPMDDGAVGDKATDDTVALQATIDRLKAFTATDPPLSRPVVIDGQGGTYKITDSLDLTGIVLGRGWSIRNFHIVAACAADIALDFSGSRFGRLSNVHVWGDQTNQPHTGIALSRTTTAPCDRFLFDNVTLDGYFTSSALHLNAAEENSFDHCVFANRRAADGGGESWAVILDGAGFKTLPSAYATPNNTRQSFTVNKFNRCAIQKPFGVAGPTMFLQDLASISFESCYLTNGGGSGIVWRLTDGFTPYRVYMDFQLETTGIDNFIEFTSDAVTGVHEIRGLHCTFGNMFTDSEVFEVASSVTTLALRSFKAHVYRWASGVSLAGDLFSSPSKVSIYGGDIVVPAAGDLNSPSAFARFDATVLTMDGSVVNWSYTPVLTNWTLGNGTMVGEYRKIGRTVHFDIRYTIGSTDTPSGNFVISLPFPAEGGAAGKPRGLANLFDTSAALRRNRFAIHVTTSTIALYDTDHVQVGAATPFTFATGDVIDISGSYEAAS